MPKAPPSKPLPSTGSGPQASRLAMDKLASKRLFNEKGIKTPHWEVVPRSTEPAALISGFGLPLVIKPSASGSSIGVSVVKREDQIPEALEAAGRQRGVILVEEYVPGREVASGVLGEAALPVVELVSREDFYDYQAKYSDDAGTEYLCPAPLEAEVAAAVGEAGLAAAKTLGCRHFSRVDMRISEGGVPFVLEVNTIPGFTGHSLLPKAAATAGMDFTALVERIAEMALSEAPARSASGGGDAQHGS